MSEENIIKQEEVKEPQEPPQVEPKQEEVKQEIEQAKPPEENPIISYMKTIDVSDRKTITDKIKKILLALKDKGLWDIGQKLPYEVVKPIADYVGAKNEYSVIYAIKQLQKEAVKKPKVEAETGKLELEVEGQPKEIPKEEAKEEEAKEEEAPKEEKTYTLLSLSQEDFKALLSSLNTTVKTILKTEKDVYPPELINLLSTLDAKLFSNIEVETETIKVDFIQILILAVILHALPIIPLLPNILKPPLRKA